jgi:hypothetical protein
MNSKNFKQLIHELKHHLPFTLAATTIAIAVVLLLKGFLVKELNENIFEILHPLHIIASGMVSAGIFYKYKKNLIYAFGVGITSAILVGSISDVIFPFLGGIIFGLDMHFHLPLIESPIIIICMALLGSIAGILTKTTKIPHLFHVGLSVFASLFYMLAFSNEMSMIFFIGALVIVTIAVIIPCCVSDILMPFFFLGKKIKSCHCKH